MIFIKNSQRTFPIDISSIEYDVQRLLDASSYSDFDITVWFTTNETIRKYNRTYRLKDKPTDILSFPYHPTLKAGQRIKIKHPEDKNLGDIIIAVAYIERDAKRWNMTLNQRLRVLLVHGICHLLGYDHITDADYKIMYEKEAALLTQLGYADLIPSFESHPDS